MIGSGEQQKQAEDLIKELTENTNTYPPRYSNSMSSSSTTTTMVVDHKEDVANIDWGAVIKNSVNESSILKNNSFK